MLIEHGLDPNERHSDGYAPMHRALWGQEQRHTDTVRGFLEAGVSPRQQAGKFEPVEITQRIETKRVLHEYLHPEPAYAKDEV